MIFFLILYLFFFVFFLIQIFLFVYFILSTIVLLIFYHYFIPLCPPILFILLSFLPSLPNLPSPRFFSSPLFICLSLSVSPSVSFSQFCLLFPRLQFYLFPPPHSLLSLPIPFSFNFHDRAVSPLLSCLFSFFLFSHSLHLSLFIFLALFTHLRLASSLSFSFTLSFHFSLSLSLFLFSSVPATLKIFSH